MNNICVVLVQPQGPLNIGAICRIMMNFGIYDLRLVNPCEDYYGFESKRMALKSVSILDQARIFKTLKGAIEDCSLIFGTTRRFGKYRKKNSFLSPLQAAKQISISSKGSQVAYVFGREDVGLYNSELELCNFYVTIETNIAYISMNLSHAVSICMYELQKQFSNECYEKIDSRLVLLANSKELEIMFQHMKKTLFNIEYLNHENPDHIIRSIRKILYRAGLDDREVRILQGLWSRIDWVYKKRCKCKNDSLKCED